MVMGIRLKAQSSNHQKLVLSQWMGCARFIGDAQCEENKHLTKFAQKYMPLQTYAPIDRTYSRYKNPELSPWLKDCPSRILGNSAVESEGGE
jgi:putative transposase